MKSFKEWLIENEVAKPNNWALYNALITEKPAWKDFIDDLIRKKSNPEVKEALRYALTDWLETKNAGQEPAFMSPWIRQIFDAIYKMAHVDKVGAKALYSSFRSALATDGYQLEVPQTTHGNEGRIESLSDRDDHSGKIYGVVSPIVMLNGRLFQPARVFTSPIR